jgi:hypothetical protein
MKKMILLSIVMLISSGFAHGYEKNKKPMKKNALYANVGTSLMWTEATVNIERLISLNQKGNVAFGIQLGYGGWALLLDDAGKFFNPKLMLLAGNQEGKFFELTAGANLYTDPDNYYYYATSPLVAGGSIGYRRHFADGMMARCGLGWPTGLYLGVGMRF